MSVHIRKDGAWIVRYREDGREKTKYFGKGPQAQVEAADYNRALGMREWVRRTQGAMSVYFSDLAKLYWDATAGRMSEPNRKLLRDKLNNQIIPALGDYVAESITPEILDRFVSKRLQTPYFRRKGGEPRYPKATTIHREITAVIAILRWGKARGFYPMSPADGWQKPKRDDEVIRPPSMDEMRRLMAAAPEHLKRALCLSYYLGVRPGGELLKMRWDAIDWGEKCAWIQSAKKGGLRSRSVALHPDLEAMLREWSENDPCKSDFIVAYRGRSVSSIKTTWRATLRRAQIGRRIRIYDCRHAFATAALRQSGDIKTVSGILGHSRPDTTIKTYVHSDPDRERAIIGRLPSLVVTDVTVSEKENV